MITRLLVVLIVLTLAPMQVLGAPVGTADRA